MNVEQTLADELRAVGAAVRPPPAPPVAQLARRARADRTRSVLRSGATVLLAAAAILGIIVWGSHLDSPTTAPSPAHRPTALPTGEPPKIPYVKIDQLYVDGQVQPGSWIGVVTRGATSVGYLDDANRLIETIELFHDGSRVGRFPDVSPQGVLLSPAGARAAWVQRAGQEWFLVVYDVGLAREQGRLPVGASALGHVGAENEGWESLSSLDDAGTVRWGGVLKQHTWTPGQAPEASAPTANPPAPSGEFPVDHDVVSISPDGAWGAWTVDHTGDQPQGTSKIPDQYDMALFAQKPGRPSTRIRFALPRNANASGIAWETSGAFLVTVADDPTGTTRHYLRCLVATRSCELAPTPENP